MAKLSPKEIRDLQMGNLKMRARDLAEQHGLSEADLVAANIGVDTIRIDPDPDRIMAAAQLLGEVMALTRTASCVHEKIGVYDNYHSGKHASMVLNEDIDLRIFASHWKHAFLVERKTEAGISRSLQVFDAAGDSVHKIFLRATSDLSPWDGLKETLAVDDQSQAVDLDPRKAPEAPKSDLSKLDILRKEWARLTDTHQFLRLTSKLKMNRLGAYRIAGAPFVRQLGVEAVDQMLHDLQGTGTPVMIFVGNRGCIQIHSGPILNLKAMGPWQNVIDPNFNLHLRLDHVAEVWAVDKPTQRGPALSVEAFDKDGTIIFQIFGIGREGSDSRPAWAEVVSKLPSRAEEAVS